MAARISKACRGSGAALAGLATLALSACGLRVPAQPPVRQTAAPSPTQPAPSPTTPAPTPSPATATPTPTQTPPPIRKHTPSPTRTPSRIPMPPPSYGPSGFVVPGRPLRLRRRLLSPTVGRGSAPVHPDHERLGALPAPLRTDLAALWLHAARMEHASVPAFADLALLLSAVGAPLDLVSAAHRAALDEVGHTEVSYALANAYGGTAASPGALPRLLGRRTGSRGHARTLRRLAVEALRDGCLNEGYNAALAAAGAAAATDPAVREALSRIAREEAAHTELSWQVLGWSLSAGGPDVANAVAKALRTLPAAGPAPTPRDDLEDHGWPAPATAAAAYAGVRASVAERAAGLLALTA